MANLLVDALAVKKESGLVFQLVAQTDFQWVCRWVALMVSKWVVL